MRNIKENKMLYFSIACFISCILLILINLYYYNTRDIQSTIGFLLIATAIFIFLNYFKDDIFNPLIIYSIFWLGVAGISTFRVSLHQNRWTKYMWLIVILAYITFVLGFLILKRKKKMVECFKYCNINKNKLYFCIKTLTFLALICFLLEVIIIKKIPLFSEDMSAYREFYVTGVHYFVVSVGIIPVLTILYKKIGGEKKIIYINIVSISISILIVSRQLLIMQCVLIVLGYNYLIKKIRIKKIIILFLVSLILFSASFSLRNQSTEYINNVANVLPKYQKNIFIKPLLYFNMNFENLRNTVENFNDYKYGENMLFPILAFVNLKDYINYDYKDQYLTNINFNTSTYLTDIYYDFGILGVIIIPFILGLLYSVLYNNMKRNISIINIIYFLLLYCLIFCFFVNWYYNTAIIFDIVIIMIIYFYCKNKEIKKYID